MTEVAERRRSRARKEKVVHFDLEGAWYADFCRTRLEEGAWERALAMLVDNLHGMTHDQAVAILRGRATLTGWASDKDGIGYEELPDTHETAVRMDGIHDYLYGSCFRWHEDYWKPYAVVVGYGEQDMDFARKNSRPARRCSGFPETDGWRYAVQRALFYANSTDADMVVYVPYPSKDFGTVVLCERAKMPPTWVRVSIDAPEVHLKALMEAGKRWEQRGAFEDLPMTRSEEKPAAKRVRPAKTLTPAQSLQTPNQLAKEFLERLNATETSEDISALGAEFDRRLQEANERDEDDVLAAAEKAAQERRLAFYRAEIAEQAEVHGGWLELRVTDEQGNLMTEGAPILRVPRNPFLLWSLKGFDFEANGKERPEWRTVCPSGMKMYMDDPYHTDWMVGAGLDPEQAYALNDKSYSSRVQSCAFHLRSKITSEWCEAEFVTLAKGTEDRIYGTVVHPQPNEAVEPGSIAVVPHAGPEYQLALESACKKGRYGRPGAVICEIGGPLAHLAVVGRELKHTLLMVPNARDRFAEGTSLTIDVAKGKLSWG